MNEYCGDCEYLGRKENETYKDWWTGETTYKCRLKGDYKKINSPSCSNIKPIKKDNGNYTPSGCYITTIVTNILGYSDDCELLNTLREFRNNYLRLNPEYLSILMEYDIVGPLISKNIYNDENNYKLSLELTQNFLIPCVNYIKNNNYDDAINTYKNMVNSLKEKYNLADYTIDINRDYDIETLGTGRILKPSEI